MRVWVILSLISIFLLDLGADGKVGPCPKGARRTFGIFSHTEFPQKPISDNNYHIGNDIINDTNQVKGGLLYITKLSKPFDNQNNLTAYVGLNRNIKYRPPP
jgi:hypothetical protein